MQILILFYYLCQSINCDRTDLPAFLEAKKILEGLSGAEGIVKIAKLKMVERTANLFIKSGKGGYLLK